ncbi:MAG: hypothetical protein J1E16_05700 [Muribaculaceae bacterium]|nr:hypothetical protein [Muribaculaceae bacterium]
MKKIHLSTAREMLKAPDPVDLSVWKKDGSIMHLHDCISLHYDFYGGWRNVKCLQSGEMRRIRDCLIFQINGLEVFL